MKDSAWAIISLDWVAFPDTLAGADSHTPMTNALGVLGWVWTASRLKPSCSVSKSPCCYRR